MTAVDRCRRPVGNNPRPCHLPRGHTGTCLAPHIPWPRSEVTDNNPSFNEPARRAS